MGELDTLRVREEVLQALYWMHAEGLADAPSPTELSRFLAVPAATLGPYLDRFVEEGYLERRAEGYALTATGLEAGKRTFADEFAGLTGQAHGQCDEDCWCHESPEEAARCLEERAQQHVS
jgi:hypothetical protein